MLLLLLDSPLWLLLSCHSCLEFLVHLHCLNGPFYVVSYCLCLAFSFEACTIAAVGWHFRLSEEPFWVSHNFPTPLRDLKYVSLVHQWLLVGR